MTDSRMGHGVAHSIAATRGVVPPTPAFSLLAVCLTALMAICLALLLPHAHAQAPAAASPHTQRTLAVEPATLGKRVALVVGNADYARAPLVNPLNDAADLAAALRRLGFEVMERRNRGSEELKRDLIEFQDKLGPGAVGLFYFAGHGVQAGRGARNYLLPVGVDYQRERDAEVFGLDAASVLARMEESGAALSLMILDACRDSPLPSDGRSTGNRGLGRMEAPSGSLVAFATAPGSTADENRGGRNGLYTQYLLQAIETPGLRLEDVFKQVRRDVERASQRRQSPEEVSKLTSDFYFVPPAAVGAALPSMSAAPLATAVQPAGQLASAAVPDPEIDLWNLAKRRDNAASYEAYLRAYPQGRYAQAARSALEGLRPVAPAAVTTVSSGAVSSAPTQLPLGQGLPHAPPVAPPPPRAGDVLRDCADCPQMVVVPAGRFAMGSPATEPGRSADEGPVRQVEIREPIAIARHELTRGEFARFVQATGYRTDAERDVGSPGCVVWTGSRWEPQAGRHWREPGFEQTDAHPAVCLSWNDAQAYLRWLNTLLPGRAYRLPSEAEWEHAARAGRGGTSFPWGEDSRAVDQCAWANGGDRSTARTLPRFGGRVADCDDGHPYTAPAGSLKPNAFGLHEMHGNVWEWMQDVWHPSYDGAPTDGSAWTLGGDASRRVLRGGSWSASPNRIRSAGRLRYPPEFRGSNVGFRVARSL